MYELKSTGGIKLHKGIRRIAGCGTFVIFLVFPAAFILFEKVLDISGIWVFSVFCLMFFPLVGLMLAFLFGTRLLFERVRGWKIGEAAATLSDHPLQPGQDFGFNLDQPINGPSNIEQVSVSLIFREMVRYTVGTDTRTDTHDRVIQQVDLPGRRMQPGHHLYESVDLTIPADSMHSWPGESTIEDLKEEVRHQSQMKTGQQPPRWLMNVLGKVATVQSWGHYNNTLQWVIRLHVKIQGWIDYIDEYRIDVLPEGAAAES